MSAVRMHPLLFVLLAFSSSGWAATSLKLIDVEVRTPLGMGFFPLGGNATVKSVELATYIAGPSIDLLSVVDEDDDPFGRHYKNKIGFNVSAFLVGLDWTSLQKTSTEQPKTARVLNLAYIRAGLQLDYAMLGPLRQGFQIGYGMLLLNEDRETGTVLANVRYLHGFDVSYTIAY